MSDRADLPFGHNTVKIRAVFVPDGAEISMADITRVVGPHPVMIPAVWVPEGGALPGYPYEHIGRAVFIPDEQDEVGRCRRGRGGNGQLGRYRRPQRFLFRPPGRALGAASSRAVRAVT